MSRPHTAETEAVAVAFAEIAIMELGVDEDQMEAPLEHAGDKLVAVVEQHFVSRLHHDRRVTEVLEANNREVENRRAMAAAMRETENKLWVLRCNSRDPLDRAAAEAAIAQSEAARKGVTR